MRALIKAAFNTCMALLVLLFFVGYEQTPSFTGAVHYSSAFVENTLSGKMLFENFWGINVTQILLTIRLIAVSIFLSIMIGVYISIVRVRSTKLIRNGVSLLTDIVESIPESLFALIALAVVIYLVLYSTWFSWLPVFPDHTPDLLDTIIPSLVLGLPAGLVLERQLYLRLTDEMNTQYAMFALAKGLSARKVFYRHVFPNTFVTIFGQLPGMFAMILSSALFVEFFMGYQGALYMFPYAIGWNFLTGTYLAQKMSGLPEYQPGIVFLIGSTLILSFTVFNVGIHSLRRFWGIEGARASQTGKVRRIDLRWIFAGVVLLLIIVILGVYPQFITTQSPFLKHLANLQTGQSAPFPPSHIHPFGTDSFGRDLLARTLYGTLNTLYPVVISTFDVMIISLLLAIIAFLQPSAWASKIIRFANDVFTSLPVILVLILALNVRHLHAHHQLLSFVLWIVFAEIWRNSYTLSRLFVEWSKFDFVEGAVSVGASRLRIALVHFRPWLIRNFSELFFSEFTRIVSIMTVLAAFHIYVYEKFDWVPFLEPSQQGIVSANMSWLSLIGDATTNISFTSYPYVLYGPICALAVTMLAANFIARGIRGK